VLGRIEFAHIKSGRLELAEAWRIHHKEEVTRQAGHQLKAAVDIRDRRAGSLSAVDQHDGGSRHLGSLGIRHHSANRCGQAVDCAAGEQEKSENAGQSTHKRIVEVAGVSWRGN
jgi:hypothetical protein